jgi:hypothetical protein
MRLRQFKVKLRQKEVKITHWWGRRGRRQGKVSKKPGALSAVQRVSAECIITLFCNICESEEHVAAKCPLKKKPKPVALAVGYAVDDLEFYHIPHGPITPSKMDSITAVIKVEGGSLTEEDLRGHLKRLFSANFDWDL